MMVQYLIESTCCLAVLYLLYQVLLRRETFFQWNRLYLLLAPAVSFVLPALDIRLEQAAPDPAAAPLTPELPVWVERTQRIPMAMEQTFAQPAASALSLGEFIWWLYLSVAAVLALRLLVQLGLLLRFIYRSRREHNGLVTLTRSHPDTPLASFFGFVFWHPRSDDDEARRWMLEHEMVHVRQWHSLDILWIEALLVVWWFNPLLYGYRRSLRVLHEYIADEEVVRRTRERYAYARLLISQQTGVRARAGLVNTFHSLIKHRLKMLAQQPSAPLNRAKYLLVVPCAIALMLLFSFRLVENTPLQEAVRNVNSHADRLANASLPASISEAVNTLQGDAENSPYIFYWGQFQVRLMYKRSSGAYFAPVYLDPADFRLAIQREPRLWNGHSMEAVLAFSLNGIQVQSDIDNPELYQRSAKALDDFAYSIQPDAIFQILNLTLPNGEKAQVDLLFQQKMDPKENYTIYMDESNRYRYFDYHVEYARGNMSWVQLDKSRRFFTAEEIKNALLASAPVMLDDDKQPVPEGTAYMSWQNPDQRSGKFSMLCNQDQAGYTENIRQLYQDNTFNFQSGATLYFEFANLPGVKNGVRSAYRQVMIVPEGSTLLSLTADDLYPFTFEWGNVSQKTIPVYARAMQLGDRQIPVDPYYSFFDNKMQVSDVKKMLRLSPHVWKSDKLLSNVSMHVQYGEWEADYAPGSGLPEWFLLHIDRHLKGGDKLEISQIGADGIELLNIDIVLYIRAEEDTEKSVDKRSDAAASMRIQVSPVPASDKATFVFTLPEASRGNFRITDARGVLLYSKSLDLPAEGGTHTVLVSDLNAKGTVFATLETPAGMVTSEFILW